MRSKTICYHKDVTITFKATNWLIRPKELVSSTGERISVLSQVVIYVCMTIKVNNQIVYEEDVKVSGSPYDIERKLDNFFEALSKKEGFLDD
nr:MAG TPA: hypothetical protein [Caudoviricetes sp.]